MPARIALSLIALTLVCVGGSLHAQQPATQGILGPGAYIYQTRLDEATCQPDSTSGFVRSYFAAINGMPGARSMNMQLLNSPHWPEWNITVRADGTIVGDADQTAARGVRMGHSHFEVRERGDRFVGRGFREYSARIDGEMRRCRNEYDALLKRIDD